MADVIVAMPKLADAKKIADLLRSQGITPAALCTTGAEVLQEMNALDYGLVLCSAKFPDMGFAEISEYMPNYFKMILMTRDPDMDYSFSHIVKLMIPFRVGDLIETVNAVIGELDSYYKKRRPKPPKRSEEEKDIIDRAKKVLMEQNGMTEPESYRYIQKCSMDSGTKLIEAAEMVLLLYESS